jgi:hypothetical protein
MKLVNFTPGQGARLGLVRGEQVVDLTSASEGHLPTDMLTFLQQGEAALELARQLEHSAAADLALAEVKLLAPCQGCGNRLELYGPLPGTER